MTPEITDLIKKKAEERAKEYEKGSWEHFLLSEAFKDGQTEGIELNKDSIFLSEGSRMQVTNLAIHLTQFYFKYKK